MEGGHRRLSLLEQMSALESSGGNSLTGLTLDAILSATKSQQPTRTLLDIIRDEAPHKDKKTWKIFRDKLRLKRAGAAWTSSMHVPASDIPIRNTRSQVSRSGSFRNNSEDLLEPVPISDPPTETSRPLFARHSSSRFAMTPGQHDQDEQVDITMPNEGHPARSFRPQISRHNSTRFPSSNSEASHDDDSTARDGTRRLAAVLSEERALSAREAVAAQEAAEAEAAAAAAAAEAEEAARATERSPGVGVQPEPVRMSLMDLLEETDRQMGLTGSRYMMGDDDEYEEEEEEEVEAPGGIEYTCCVCMVRHKGSAFIPCGHTFCRLCSRELWVQRGNCPLCNGFILEILDIF